MSKTKNNLTFNNIPQTWGELNALRPLRPIHDKVDAENATEIIDAMAGHELNQDQDDYLDSLSTLLMTYEDEHDPVEVESDGIEILKSFMADHEMSNGQLGELLGVSRSHVTRLLNGERSLTVHQMQILGKRFAVRPDLFMGKEKNND